MGATPRPSPLPRWKRGFGLPMHTRRGLPVPPGTVAWATLDAEHGNCCVNLTDVGETEYEEYIETLKQEGFSVVENVSEQIQGQDYVSIGTLFLKEDKWISISYMPDSFVIYISLEGQQ